MKTELTYYQMKNLIYNLKLSCKDSSKEWVQYPVPQNDNESQYTITWDPTLILKDKIPPKEQMNVQRSIMPCYTLDDMILLVLHNPEEKDTLYIEKNNQEYYSKDPKTGIEFYFEELIDLLYSIYCMRNK